jgi:hypothetical protein
MTPPSLSASRETPRDRAASEPLPERTAPRRVRSSHEARDRALRRNVENFCRPKRAARDESLQQESSSLAGMRMKTAGTYFRAAKHVRRSKRNWRDSSREEAGEDDRAIQGCPRSKLGRRWFLARSGSRSRVVPVRRPGGVVRSSSWAWTRRRCSPASSRSGRRSR